MTKQEYLLLSDYEIAEEFGQWAAKERIALNLTQEMFSKKSGIPFPTYRKFEQTGKISFPQFICILRYLGSLGDLTEVMDKSLGKRSIAEAIKFENVKERKRASKQKR